MSLLVAPVLYSFNYYCVTRLIEDEAMRPGRALKLWAVGGIVLMTLAAGFYTYTRL